MQTVDITVPVTPAAAERWRDPAERARLGALLSVMLAPGTTEAEIAEAVRLFAAPERERRRALAEVLADMGRAAAEAELAAWKGERATRRRR